MREFDTTKPLYWLLDVTHRECEGRIVELHVDQASAEASFKDLALVNKPGALIAELYPIQLSPRPGDDDNDANDARQQDLFASSAVH